MLALDAAVRAAQAVPAPAFLLVPARLRAIKVAAELWLDPDADADVASKATAALCAAFGFARSGFGVPVTAAAVVAVLQSQAGVAGLRLDLLYADGAPAMLNQRLTPAPAHWDPGGRSASAAELLVLHADGVVLTAGPAPAPLPVHG
jgi:hypothetical protein